jgi:tRNA dimethylallyltransferase
VYALTGCTGVGKTEWALRWAEQKGAEIISCDSLLFYRGMNIGTAKPTASELARVPHHLIDCCEVTERMDVTRFIRLARAAVADVLSRDRRVLIVGGSGFYLKALFSPVADAIQVPPEIRARVAAWSGEEALNQLRAINPQGLGLLDTANPRRVTRALERCLASGKTVDVLVAEFAEQPSAFADWQVTLTRIEREPADLDRRIAERVAMMLGAGLIDEVRRLLDRGLKENPSASRAIGYREVIDHLEGRLSESELAAEITRNTRKLAKKQRTWFRTQLPPHHLVNATTLSSPGDLFAG